MDSVSLGDSNTGTIQMNLNHFSIYEVSPFSSGRAEL